MNKLVAFVVVLTVLTLVQFGLADIYFKRVPISEKSVEEFEAAGKGKFKCIPGRTIIKYQEKPPVSENVANSGSSEEETLRSHMNFLHYGQKDESCKMCVCSAEGQDEYCVRRPAVNINECLEMKKYTEEFQQNIPFSHDRDLSHMIRRDYIWHRDEIPYDSNAKCYRGTSYYTNNPRPNATEIGEMPDDVPSMIGFENTTVCYFCVCSASGYEIACIRRHSYFCDYYRMLTRDEDAVRDMYTTEFGQDRPKYFQTLSQRMRRMMDDGVYDLIETAGVKPGGSCVPYISEYTDCNPENQCTGCTRCSCSSDSSWVCQKVRDCPKENQLIDDKSVNEALDNLLYEFRLNNKEKSIDQAPSDKKETVLVSENKNQKPNLDIEGEIISYLRDKRSTKSKSLSKEKDVNSSNSDAGNDTGIRFYHTVDELNEDTLKHSNVTGTLEAHRIDGTLPSRRTDMSAKENATFDNSLQIEYSKPQNYHQNIDNKIDSNHSEYAVNFPDIGLVTNHTQTEKDKNLSKIVVNELKAGSEFIGDKNAPVMSNITFTPENDTLTAMAFIAGNLLNKLWDMEKDASDESLEIEAMKNEKLQDLLELFKEPLTIRQEAFLKNALESLSKAIDKHKDGKNISICESLKEAKKMVEDGENMSWEKSEIKPTDKFRKNNEPQSSVLKKQNATTKAVSKMKDILSLMKRYESVQKDLNDIRYKKGKYLNKNPVDPVRGQDDHFTEDSSPNSLNMFGNVLQKITKLLLPNKSGKKMIHRIKNTHMFVNEDEVIKKKIKDMFNTDLSNTTLTVKDKIILDYLTKIKKNPKTLFDDSSYETPSSFVEKDILLNLSEFFKIKSYVDLVNLLNSNNSKIKNRLQQVQEATKSPPTSTTIITNNSFINNPPKTSNIERINTVTEQSPQSFVNTKEKFKAHLKNILDDLIELKNESGLNGKDLQLANVFPCIYNILAGSNTFNKSNTLVDPYTKISKLFEELKKEIKVTSTAMTRRMDRNELQQIMGQTPKSVIVWERVVKNVDKQKNKSARRNLEIKAPTPLKELLIKLEKMDRISSSNTDFLLNNILEPTEKLIMLKAFYAENQRNLDSLKDIKSSLDIIFNLPSEKREEISDFVDKAANKIDFHKKVLENQGSNKNIKKAQIKTALNLFSEKVSNENEQRSSKLTWQGKISEINEDNKSNKKIQLTRDAIMNQLIRNRINNYIKIVHEQDNYSDDPNYNIAKSILLNLDRGNIHSAKQLYKIFVTSKNQTSQNAVVDKTLTDKILNAKLYRDKPLVSAPVAVPSMPIVPDIIAQVRRQAIMDKEPLVHFEDPTYYANDRFLSARRDQMLRKMLTSKNLKFV